MAEKQELLRDYSVISLGSHVSFWVVSAHIHKKGWVIIILTLKAQSPHYVEPGRAMRRFITFVFAIIRPRLLILTFRYKVEHPQMILPCWLCRWSDTLTALLPREKLPWLYANMFLIHYSLEEHRGPKCKDSKATFVELIYDTTSPGLFQMSPGSRDKSSEKLEGEPLAAKFTCPLLRGHIEQHLEVVGLPSYQSFYMLFSQECPPTTRIGMSFQAIFKAAEVPWIRTVNRVD